MEIPKGLCRCGCGDATPVAKESRYGYKKGEPKKFIQGHNCCGKGKYNSRWKNGRIINFKGYALILMPNHPRASHGYVYEHLLVMEEFLGRPLTLAETVHHLDGNKSNNDLSNLVLFATKGMHAKFHHWIRRQQRRKKDEEERQASAEADTLGAH